MQPVQIKICTGKKCSSVGSEYILTRLENDKNLYKDEYKNVDISTCGCQGKCKKSIVLVLDDEKNTHQNPATASKLLREKINQIKKSR